MGKMIWVILAEVYCAIWQHLSTSIHIRCQSRRIYAEEKQNISHSNKIEKSENNWIIFFYFSEYCNTFTLLLKIIPSFSHLDAQLHLNW